MSQVHYTATIGTNADLFPQILDIYVKDGSTVADVTHGKGVFWRKVDKSRFNLLATDIKGGVDLTNLPYKDKSIDALVLDPPYMPTEYTGVNQVKDYYGIDRKFGKDRWHRAVYAIYEDGIKEANRVLTDNGVLIVKCQDMVCSNKQMLVHCDLIEYAKKWFRCEDLFVLVQPMKRKHPQKRQVHARKNHSYFLVFLKNNCKWK
jgi:tRNA G10  N-methylase Trm11